MAAPSAPSPPTTPPGGPATRPTSSPSWSATVRSGAACSTWARAPDSSAQPLLAAGHDVVAVDTSADMLAQLAVRLPGVPTFVAGAEDLPLPDADVDVVVAGQAAHWFDPARASAEFRRVLRPGGAVGFTWHTREDTSDWSVAMAGLLAADARDQTGDRPESNQAVVDAFAVALDAAVTAHTHAVGAPRAAGGRRRTGRQQQPRRPARRGRARGVPRPDPRPARHAPRDPGPRRTRRDLPDQLLAARPSLRHRSRSRAHGGGVGQHDHADADPLVRARCSPAARGRRARPGPDGRS